MKQTKTMKQTAITISMINQHSMNRTEGQTHRAVDGEQRMTNRYGITVKECCASCRNRLLMSRKRQCRITKRAVASGHVCRKWEMAEHLKNVGRLKD